MAAPSAMDSSKRKADACSSNASVPARQQEQDHQQQGGMGRGRDDIAGALGIQQYRLEPPRVAPLLALVPGP